MRSDLFIECDKKTPIIFGILKAYHRHIKPLQKKVCYLRSITLTFHEFLSIAQKLFAVPKKPINFSGNTFKAICVCFHYLFITIEGPYYLNFYREDIYVNKLYLSGTLKYPHDQYHNLTSFQKKMLMCNCVTFAAGMTL